VSIAQEDDMTTDAVPVIWFEELGRGDVLRVGGKNASLGEMVANLAAKGVKVPPGFATTAEAYWQFVDVNELRERIASALADLARGKATLAETGADPYWPPSM
jgi:pyruvate,water dikinase